MRHIHFLSLIRLEQEMYIFEQFYLMMQNTFPDIMNLQKK